MSKSKKNIILVLLLMVSFGLIYALPEPVKTCDTDINYGKLGYFCGDVYGGPNGTTWLGQKCWSGGADDKCKSTPQ